MILRYLCTLILLTTSLAASEGIDFQQGRWKDVLDRAAKEKKPVFVDTYTQWCGPCKMMDQNVFSDSSVAQLYNQRFICYKLDMESPEGRSFDSIFHIAAYPSLLFLESDGSEIFRHVGYSKVSDFITLGKQALSNKAFLAKTQKERDAFEAGTTDKSTLYKYYTVLADSNRPVDSVAVRVIKLLVPEDLKNDTAFRIWADHDHRLQSDLNEYFFANEAWFTQHDPEQVRHKKIMVVSENLIVARKTKDAGLLDNIRTFIRRSYEGQEEEDMLKMVERKFNMTR